MTWTIPLRTIFAGSPPSIREPSNEIVPDVTLPSSVMRRFEIDLSVVDLPAPLPPKSVTQDPLGTTSVIPFTARMTSL